MTKNTIMHEQDTCPICGEPFSLNVTSEYTKAFCNCGWEEREVN